MCINFSFTKDPKKIVEIILHEMVHLSIEKYVQKYKIDHKTKESIVEFLLSKIDPKRELESKFKIGYDQNNIFEKMFSTSKNIDTFLKEIKRANRI